VAAIIGAKDNIATAGKAIDVRDVAFRGPVLVRRNIAVVEHHHRPTSLWALAERHRQQCEDLQAFRTIRGEVTIVIRTICQLLFEDDLTAWICLFTQVFDG
jgi:hypothetical protein